MNALVFNRRFTIGKTDPRLFGSFVEHLGRAVYGGIFEPGHPAADARGFRTDVLDLIRELGVTIVRYPGGNFLSGYKWEDGVGPVGERPRRRDLAWMATETNAFGTNEFIDWCQAAGIEPMIAVNLGTRGPVEAGEFYEYCNHPRGTRLSDLRAAHGWPEPHAIRLWCLGNEMDGPWQMGHCDATEYGRRAREAAKLMHYPDTNRSSSALEKIEFVACGSSNRRMRTFGHWEREMLEQCFEHVQYVSLHTYFSAPLDRPVAALAQTDQMASFIEEVASTCDAVAAARKSDKRLMLSFDEWNVWAMDADRDDWQPAWSVAPPLLEQTYTFLDALLVGGMGLALLARADRVKVACLAQLVNVIAPIRTREGGPAWRQTIFWPFADLSHHGRGEVLRPAVREAGTVRQEKLNDQREGAAGSTTLQVVAVAGEDGGATVFALNRSDSPQPLKVSLEGFEACTSVVWKQLACEDLAATNTEDAPDRVMPHEAAGAHWQSGRLDAVLPPFSWNVFLVCP